MKIKTVYKYYAPWCTPCKHYAPTFDEVSEQMSSSGIEFININIDEPENSDLVVSHKIKSIPTTVKVYEDGEFESKVGAMTETGLMDFINK